MGDEKHRDPWTTDSRIFKFRDPDGTLGKAARQGATIEELRRMRPGALYRVEDVKGNIGLDPGITYMLDMMSGIQPGHVKLDAAHARIGVGNSNNPANAGQSQLEAERLGGSFEWLGMDGGHPRREGTTLIFRASAVSGVALFDWLEWAVAFDTGDGRILLNRKVENVGTKPDFDLWIFETGLRWA